MQVLDWLLGDDAPGVQRLARLRLLGESASSRRVRALKRRCNDYPPVARLLQRVDDALEFGDYKKYQGAAWTLIFLAEMEADGRDPRARRLAEHFLGQQLPEGGFGIGGRASWEVVCYTANILRSLVRLGYARRAGIARAYARLAERILPHGGVPCSIIEKHSLQTSCHMTLPQTLRALAVVPRAAAKSEVRQLKDLVVETMKKIGVYRYVRPDSRVFHHELVPLRPKGTTFSEFKSSYLKEHRLRPDELVAKKGWLRFGFPHSYNSDLLEAMLALAEAGIEHHPVMDEALDHIEAKRGKDGRWQLERSLNGKMLATIERRGAPSKWITLYALTVLQHFGRLAV